MTVLDYTFWFVLEFLARYSGATPAGWSWLYQYKYLCTLWQSGRWQIMKDQSEASISDIWPMRSSGWCGLVTSWQHQVWGAPLSRVATVAITKILKQDHSTSLIQKQYLHKTKIYLQLGNVFFSLSQILPKHQSVCISYIVCDITYDGRSWCIILASRHLLELAGLGRVHHRWFNSCCCQISARASSLGWESSQPREQWGASSRDSKGISELPSTYGNLAFLRWSSSQ